MAIPGGNQSLLNVHCIGHSLGSHFCGFISKVLRTSLNKIFTRITALGDFCFFSSKCENEEKANLFHVFRSSWPML